MEVSDKKLGTGWGFDYREKTEARMKQGLMFIQSFPHSINISCVPIICLAHCWTREMMVGRGDKTRKSPAFTHPHILARGRI